MKKEQFYENFMRESNAIEGEFELFGKAGRLNPDDVQAAKIFLSLEQITLTDILRLHANLANWRQVDWGGQWRDCNVRVGNYIAPHHTKVPALMMAYIEHFNKMDAWKAHNEFQKIHPFQDLNGRVGRLIWLWKARKERYAFDLPFLQAFYYQTLNNYGGN